MTRIRSIASLGLAVLASATVAGCSGSISVGNTGIDSVKVQSEITSKVAALAPAAGAASVVCPSDVPIAKGTSFTCTVTIDDQTLDVKVTQTDDQGNLEYVQEEAVLDLDKLTAEIVPQLVEQLGGSWTVVCEPAGKGSSIYIAAPGTDFECSASGQAGDGRSAEDLPIVVTVKDVDGQISWTTE